MAATKKDHIAGIVRACHRLAAKGFVAATDGNVSVRIDVRTIAITRSGKSKIELRAADVLSVRIDADSKPPRAKPSSELPMHIAVYNKDRTIGAVVHAHPPFATAFAASGTRLTPNVFPEVILDLGDVPLVRYAMPSSDELGALVARHTGSCNAALLANHGAVTWGRTLNEALQRMERLEHVAQIEVYARLLGGTRQLSHEQVSLLLSRHPLSTWSST